MSPSWCRLCTDLCQVLSQIVSSWDSGTNHPVFSRTYPLLSKLFSQVIYPSFSKDALPSTSQIMQGPPPQLPASQCEHWSVYTLSCLPLSGPMKWEHQFLPEASPLLLFSLPSAFTEATICSFPLSPLFAFLVCHFYQNLKQLKFLLFKRKKQEQSLSITFQASLKIYIYTQHTYTCVCTYVHMCKYM